MPNSGRQSIFSMGQEPSTPRTILENPLPAVEPWIHGYLRSDDVSDNSRHQIFSKLDRTLTDAYTDEYQPVMSSSPKQMDFLSPHGHPQNIVTEHLRAAQIARSQSPTSANSRRVSPFRPNSPWVQANDQYRTGGRFGTAQQVCEQQKAELSQPKTISPKYTMLEYNGSVDNWQKPLSPQDDFWFGQRLGDGQQHFQQAADPNFSSLPISSHPQQMPGCNFASLKQEDTADFPTQLMAMNSSASEAPPSLNPNIEKSSKPTSSLADSGTYTCTYHGCSLRFETPQKLQKHKREAHRNPQPPPSLGLGSGMMSVNIVQRNSQAGPHKCERTNPTTGKPCNTIFSRAYDLTRHENTTHNARKQKVRCALCVEEKTFSRNDALTRHMRVIHPEVDFPGKHRRRGAHDS